MVSKKDRALYNFPGGDSTREKNLLFLIYYFLFILYSFDGGAENDLF